MASDNQDQDLLQTLTDLGLEQYLPNCLQAGFHNFQSLSSITEAELTALGIRLGHRRKLLRRIAREHQWPDDRPLPSSYSELQRHRNSIRRLARGTVDPDTLEENYYSLTSTSSPQSPVPWSREASTSSSSCASRQDSVEGTRPILADVLRTSSRLFPIAIHEENSYVQEQAKVFRALRGLDDLGLRISAADRLSLPDRMMESDSEKFIRHSPNDVTPHGLKSGLRRGSGEHEVGAESLETFIQAFSQSFNHFLFLISESELQQRFDPRKWTSDADLPIDVCLVLALGAKASGSQVEDVQYDWYRKARMQLLSENCQDELWTMRVLVLICIFEIDDDIEVSYRFLNAAINIGLEKGFDTPGSTLNWTDEPSLSQWLRLWETIQFLNLWFLLQPQAMGRPLSDFSCFLNIEQPPLLSDHCRNGRLVQMSIAALSKHLQEILNDRRDSTNQPSSVLYKAHLQALDSWHAELPLYTCLHTPNLDDSRMVKPDADYRQKTAILNVQSLFLGIVCVLLQPALMTVLQNQSSSNEKELVVYARRCISSATVLIRLCDEIIGSGYPLQASWISQHFLFNATLVLIADMNRSTSTLEEFVSSNERLECIQMAQNLLDQVSSASPQATIVRLFCRAAGISDAMKMG